MVGVASAAPSDSSLKAALERIGSQTWTEADIQLISQVPELADQVIDPSAPVEDEFSIVPDGMVDRGVLSINCSTYNHDLTYYTISGGVAYKWRNSARFCMDNSTLKVTSVNERIDTLLQQDGLRYVRQRTVDQIGGVGSGSAYTHVQRAIEACVVKYGCYGITYPWSKITVRGSGFASRTGSAG